MMFFPEPGPPMPETTADRVVAWCQGVLILAIAAVLFAGAYWIVEAAGK